MRWIAATLLAVALAATLSTPSAFAKGKPIHTPGRVASGPGVSAGGGVCSNAFEMQSTDLYVLACFTGCEIAVDENQTTEQLWAVYRSAFDEGVAAVEANYGCTGWYYFA